MDEFSDISNLLDILKKFKDENKAKTFLSARGSNCSTQKICKMGR